MLKVLKLWLCHFQLVCLNFNVTLISFSDVITYNPNLRVQLFDLCSFSNDQENHGPPVPLSNFFLLLVSQQFKNAYKVVIYFLLTRILKKKQANNWQRRKYKQENVGLCLGSHFEVRIFIYKGEVRETLFCATFMDFLSFPVIINIFQRVELAFREGPENA